MQGLPNFKTKEEQIVYFYYIFQNMDKVAEICHCSKTRVQRTMKLFAKDKAIPLPLDIGRPKLLNQKLLLEICSLVLNNPHCSIEWIRKNINEKLGICYSKGLISTAVHALRFQYKPPKRRQLLTEIQKRNRISFSYKALTTLTNFENIIFSDESRFCLGSDCRWVWRRRGDYPDDIFEDKTKFQLGVMVFGAISKGFKSKLIFIEKSVDSSEYVRTLCASKVFELADSIIGKGKYVFMQDGAPAHKSKNVIKWLRYRTLLLHEWPSNSPDLNPIENIWGYMKRSLAVLNPKNLEETKEYLIKIWDSISQEHIDKLIEGWRYRLMLVMLHSGESIQAYLRHNHTGDQIVCPPLPDGISCSTEPIVVGLDVSENVNKLFPESKTSPWTPEEDQQLFQLFVKYDGNFAMISRELTRFPKDVQKRWKYVKTRREIAFSSQVIPNMDWSNLL